MAVAIRAQLIAANRVRERANDETFADAANYPEVASSFDMGTTNYCYFIGRPQPEQVNQTPVDEFVCILLFVKWMKVALTGNTVPEWDCSMMTHLDKEPLLVHSRSVRVYIEQQVAPENPVMYAIASGTHMYFLMRKSIQCTEYPRELRHVNAQCKFSYFLIKCPEGSANRLHRKKLGRLIVFYLITRWVALGKMHKKWLEFYEENHAKQDDYADSFLQCYVEECEFYGVKQPSWEALEKLWAFLITDRTFSDKGASPLSLTADGDRRYKSYTNRLQKEIDKKAKEQAIAAEKARKAREKEDAKKEKPAKKKQPTTIRNSSSNNNNNSDANAKKSSQSSNSSVTSISSGNGGGDTKLPAAPPAPKKPRAVMTQLTILDLTREASDPDVGTTRTATSATLAVTKSVATVAPSIKRPVIESSSEEDFDFAPKKAPGGVKRKANTATPPPISVSSKLVKTSLTFEKPSNQEAATASLAKSQDLRQRLAAAGQLARKKRLERKQQKEKEMKQQAESSDSSSSNSSDDSGPDEDEDSDMKRAKKESLKHFVQKKEFLDPSDLVLFDADSAPAPTSRGTKNARGKDVENHVLVARERDAYARQDAQRRQLLRDGDAPTGAASIGADDTIDSTHASRAENAREPGEDSSSEA